MRAIYLTLYAVCLENRHVILGNTLNFSRLLEEKRCSILRNDQKQYKNLYFLAKILDSTMMIVSVVSA